MFLIKPYIYNQFPEIICGITTKIGVNRKVPFYFNISNSVGAKKFLDDENFNALLTELKINDYIIHFQHQIHSDIVRIVNSNSVPEQSDAMVCTDNKNALAVIVADCVPIFIYDSKQKIIASVHSGWKGTHKKILEKTLSLLSVKFNSDAKDLFIYLGPSISQANYQVGKEVAELFDNKYILKINNSFFLDVAAANYQILIDFGVPPNQIQKSLLCTYEYKDLFHSYRRDGNNAGRQIGIIGLK